MPRESAFVQAVDPKAEWGATEHLIATMVDVTLATHGANERIPRPGQREEQIARATARGERWAKRAAERAQQRREASTS